MQLRVEEVEQLKLGAKSVVNGEAGRAKSIS